MNEKVRKTLYIPAWLGEILDSEGEIYGGPGTVAATAIHSFSILSPAEKSEAFKQYRNVEIDAAMVSNDDQQALEKEKKHKKLKRGRSRSA